MTRLLPIGAAEAEAAARIRVNLDKKGTPIGPCDLLIVGTALAPLSGLSRPTRAPLATEWLLLLLAIFLSNAVNAFGERRFRLGSES